MSKYRLVTYKDQVLVAGRWVLQEIGEAKFHQFGVDYEEFESGAGNFTTAILELSTGEVISVRADRIKFIGEVYL